MRKPVARGTGIIAMVSGRALHGGLGGVSEWLKELVSKTSRCHSLVGSNPTPSALARVRVGFIGYRAYVRSTISREGSHSWSSARAWKARIPKGIEGSNPSPSAPLTPP